MVRWAGDEPDPGRGRRGDSADGMSDAPDPTDGGQRTRRPPRLGDSRAPATTITVLAIAAVAVIAGLLILRSVTGESTRADDEADTSSTTTSLPPVVITVGPVASSTTVAPPAPAPAAAKSDATLMVVNASGVGGSATAMSAELAANGYTTSRVANATGGRLQQSVIYYIAGQPAAEAVARLLNAQIPQAQLAPMPDPPPLDRPLGDATVALLIGGDIAGQPLAALGGRLRPSRITQLRRTGRWRAARCSIGPARPAGRPGP